MPDLRDEMKAPAEPLLPVEKKLIGWSLSIGLALLVLLRPAQSCRSVPVRAGPREEP